MVDKIEMSLDDIIKQNKKTIVKKIGGKGRPNKQGPKKGPLRGVRKMNKPMRGGPAGRGFARGGGAGAGPRRLRTDMNGAWKHDKYNDAKKTGNRPAASSAKLLVSNLDFGVSDSDIQELFSEFGPLKSAAVHYDRSGRSLGSADVIFERRGDAFKAMKQYNGVPLDGREMNIQMAMSELPAANAPRKPNQKVTSQVFKKARFTPFNKTAGKDNKSPAKKGNKPGGKAPKKQLTAEDLDAELDAYVKEVK